MYAQNGCRNIVHKYDILGMKDSHVNRPGMKKANIGPNYKIIYFFVITYVLI